jgi:3-phenylpropionate/cinnamic acid dioxygenase small subunit
LEALCGGYAGDVRKRFFFEKKKQKTFTHGSPVDRSWQKPNGKSFLVLFFKKALPPFPFLIEISAMDHRTIEQFLYREARLADEHRLRDWLALCTDDILYWIPAGADEIDPARQVSIVYDDRNRLLDRIGYLETGALNIDMRSRMRRVISNIEIDGDEVSSNFILVEAREDQQYVWCGRTIHRLREAEGGLKMCYKKVLLVNNAQVMPVFQFII